MKKTFEFYWGNSFEFTYSICGYFDNRPIITISPGFYTLYIRLPFRNKWTDECDPPKCGVAIHNQTFWIYKWGKGNGNGGNKWWTWNIPFITKSCIRHSILLKDGTWEHELNKENKNFWKDEWNEKKMSWDTTYVDKYDDEMIPTKIYVEEREWRPKWLTWTKKFAKIRRVIDVHFSSEVGKRKGSWKGGTIGCSYEILNGEEPLECLKRMEKERDL